MCTLDFSGAGKVCWKQNFRILHKEYKDQTLGTFVCLLLERHLLRWDSKFVIQTRPWSGLPRNCNRGNNLYHPKVAQTDSGVLLFSGLVGFFPWDEGTQWCPSRTKIKNARSYTGTFCDWCSAQGLHLRALRFKDKKLIWTLLLQWDGVILCKFMVDQNLHALSIYRMGNRDVHHKSAE